MTNICTGLSAFPLTPLRNDTVDEPAFIALIERLRDAGVESITALGSTGSAAYLSEQERARVAELAVQHAGQIPVIVGVSALRTSHVLANIDRAVTAGAAGLLLAPMSYQPLTDDDVFELFYTVSGHTDLSVIVYDNPATTHFTFTPELYARVARLPGIASLKLPGVPNDPAAARAHVAAIRALLPAEVTIGVAGDAFAATGMNAGCDVWYSVIGGLLPEVALSISRPAQRGDAAAAASASERFAPLWDLFRELGGSLRVTAAIAEQLGRATPSCLPLPIQGLGAAERARVREVMRQLELGRE